MNGLPSFEEIDRKSTAEVALEDLKESILGGSVPPATRLIEARSGDPMAISRSAVRAALRMLEADGLIDVSPKHGTCVKQLSAREPWEAHTAHQLIEDYVAALAAGTVPSDAVGGLEAALERSLNLAEADDYHRDGESQLRGQSLDLGSARSHLIEQQVRRPMPGVSSGLYTARLKDSHNGRVARHLIHSHKEH